MPAVLKSSQLPSTSSRMLTRSVEKHRHLERQREEPRALVIKRPFMLDVPALLLTTLEDLTGEQLKTFQSYLTSFQLAGFPPIPENQLENANRQDTVDQMVERYDPEAAVEITLMILKRMDQNDLTKKLQRDHRGKKRERSESPLTSPSLMPFWPDLASGYKATEEDCVRLIGSSSSAMWTEASGSKDTGIQQDKYELFTETPKLSDLDPERGLEMANSLNTQVAVNTQENTQRMDEELGRERDSPLFLEQHHMSSPDEFTPEIHDQDNRGEYRFQCPSAGLFQCSITGLVFRMEGEGEVLYRTVPWDRRLLAQRGKIPAGPLFKFTCLKGSVCQLHLPHCEIHSEGGCDFLSVAHVTDDDSMEFLRPHETTETHVILNINGFSKYGITKDKEAPVSPIHALVLLFYQLPDDTNNSTLNVLLMPRNVDIDEVCKTRRTRNGDREIYIEKNSNCRLTPDQKYTLSTDLIDEHHIDPKEAEFVDYDFYTNYTPTFQLDLQTVIKKVNLLLKEHDGPENECVWNRLVSLPVSPTEVPSSVTPPGGATAASKLLVPAAHPMDISTHRPQRTYPTSMEPVAVSEREQMPAGAHNANLPSTSSGMLTRSVEKRLRLERQREEPRALGIKRPSMLDVPAPLLTTLEELTGEQLKTFQSYLTSVQLPGFPPIPENQLENADRQDTVDQMVKRYDPEGAVRITLMNLRKMHQHDLAKKLQRDLRVTPPGGATAGTTKVHFLLLDTLQELGTSDLNTFQWYLIKGVEGFPSISKGQLGDADTLVTVDKMVQSYGDEGAVKFTLKILRKMGQNKLADELKEKVTKNV